MVVFVRDTEGVFALPFSRRLPSSTDPATGTPPVKTYRNLATSIAPKADRADSRKSCNLAYSLASLRPVTAWVNVRFGSIAADAFRANAD